MRISQGQNWGCSAKGKRKGFRNYFSDPGKNGRIILKWILKKQEVKLWNNFYL
jgi:hypothetical protein